MSVTVLTRTLLHSLPLFLSAATTCKKSKVRMRADPTRPSFFCCAVTPPGSRCKFTSGLTRCALEEGLGPEIYYLCLDQEARADRGTHDGGNSSHRTRTNTSQKPWESLNCMVLQGLFGASFIILSEQPTHTHTLTQASGQLERTHAEFRRARAASVFPGGVGPSGVSQSAAWCDCLPVPFVIGRHISLPGRSVGQ